MRADADGHAAAIENLVRRPKVAIAGVLTEAAERFDDVAVVAKREAERMTEIAGLAPTTAVVPALDSDIHDLDGLLRLGTYLWRSG